MFSGESRTSGLQAHRVKWSNCCCCLVASVVFIFLIRTHLSFPVSLRLFYSVQNLPFPHHLFFVRTRQFTAQKWATKRQKKKINFLHNAHKLTFLLNSFANQRERRKVLNVRAPSRHFPYLPLKHASFFAHLSAKKLAKSRTSVHTFNEGRREIEKGGKHKLEGFSLGPSVLTRAKGEGGRVWVFAKSHILPFPPVTEEGTEEEAKRKELFHNPKRRGQTTSCPLPLFFLKK